MKRRNRQTGDEKQREGELKEVRDEEGKELRHGEKKKQTGR